MKKLENFSLKPFNTFGIDVKAKFFAEVFTDDELLQLIISLDHDKKPLLLLGGGSNILFTGDVDGTVIKISTKGIRVVSESSDEIIVNVQAGENWDEFVGHCVSKGWGGLENLSLIPGNTGTGPVQNIGAYGVEIKDTIEEVQTYDRTTRSKVIFPASKCEFAYRDSIFKRFPDRYLILNVTFKLSKLPRLNMDYKDVREEVRIMGPGSPDISAVREAVCRIRRRKLPDPEKIGNAGSFFKNPVMGKEQFSSLKEKFQGIGSFTQDNGIKIAAAWLIDQCGWKGYRSGDAGVHPQQPLVLVNWGSATGHEILELAEQIQSDVEKKFGIILEKEVRVL